MTAALSPGAGAITLFVDDVVRAKAWYQRAFDLPVLFEDDVSAALDVEFENTVINLLVRAEAHALIAPAAVAAGSAGAQAQFTIWVDDTDATCAELDRPRRDAAQRSHGPPLGAAHGLLRRS